MATHRLHRIVPTLLLLVVNAACTAPTPEELLQDARDAFAAGEVRTADIHLKNLLQRSPDNAAARALMAEVSIAQGDFGLAEESVHRAVELGADPAGLQVTLLRALAGQGKYADVVAAFAEDPELSDQDRAAALGIEGSSLQRLGKLSEAEAAFRAALAIQPESTDLRTQLAALLVDMGNVDEAWRLVSDVLRRRPEHTGALLIRGSIEVSSGRLDAAERSFREVIRLEGGENQRGADYLAALAGLTELQLGAGKLDEAALNADTLLTSAPNSPVARFLKASLEVQQGSLDSAEQQLQQLVVDAPRYWPAYRLMGAIDARQNQLNLAEANLAMAVRNNPADARARLQLADVYVRQGKLDDARGLFGGAAAAQRSDSLFLAVAGGASLRVGQADLAESYFGQIENFQAENVQQLAELTSVFVAAGEFDRAVSLIESTKFEDADSRLAADSLIGLVRLRQGNTEAATEIANRTIAEHPTAAWAYILRGMIAFSARDFEPARDAFQTALEHDATNITALFNLASCAFVMNDVAGATKYLERIVAIDANQPNALFALTEVAITRKDFAKARAWAEQAPDSALRYTMLGRVAESAGNFADAAAEYSRAFAAQPSVAAATRSYWAGSQAGEPDAEEELLAWLADHPLDVQANALLGSAAMNSGNAEQAIERFERVVDAAPTHAIALNNLAWLYGERGDDRAIAFGERARAAAPDDPAVADTLGWLYAQRGDYERARPLLERAATALPNAPEAQYHWAVALSETGDVAGAAKILRGLVGSGASFPSRADAERWVEDHRDAAAGP